MTAATDLGREFVAALAEKDFDRLLDLFHPEIDFRGMTPRKFWEAGNADTVVSDILRSWFEESDEIVSLDAVEVGAVADCERVGYRFTVTNPEGRFLVEQQSYLTERDGQIGWMRVMCSGFRHVEDDA